MIRVWKRMYERGIVQKLTDIHVKSWPAWHKGGEVLPAHRWFVNAFEREMREIDPHVTLPYWDPYLYGSQPERSSIWETFGHSGIYSNGYSVCDGMYSEFNLIPTLKRHWLRNGTILPWFTQEFMTFTIQSVQAYNQMGLYSLGYHFPFHLNIGVYEGQFSYRNAPYDVLFALSHVQFSDILNLRWQLRDRKFLTPLSYNLNNIRFNPFNGKPNLKPNILTDTLTGLPNVTIRELFWFGFGDLCSIPDQFIEPINNRLKGVKDVIPTAAQRLPKTILKKYFPNFYSGHFSGLYHTLEEVGECNNVCHPIPKLTQMRDTEAGRLQFEAFRYDNNWDINQSVIEVEEVYHQLWVDLNESGYCSPYVTKY